MVALAVSIAAHAISILLVLYTNLIQHQAVVVEILNLITGCAGAAVNDFAGVVFCRRSWRESWLMHYWRRWW